MSTRGWQCGYCGGRVEWSDQRCRYVHADDGARVRPGGPGDLASAAHNQAGTRVGAYDLVDTAAE